MAGPVDPDRYVRALGDDDPLEAMAEAPGRLRRLLARLPERQLVTRLDPGKWSIREIVAHLADAEVILGSRYRFVAAHDRPPLPGFDQDLFVARLGVDSARTQDLLDDFSMARAVNLGLLSRLPPAAFSRAGLHSERGEESLEAMVRMYAGHDRIHIAQVAAIRARLVPARKPVTRRKTPASRAVRPR